jgi:hypothetical protein
MWFLRQVKTHAVWNHKLIKLIYTYLYLSKDNMYFCQYKFLSIVVDIDGKTICVDSK